MNVYMYVCAYACMYAFIQPFYYRQNLIQGQLSSKLGFEFRVFLSLDWLPDHGKRTQSAI